MADILVKIGGDARAFRRTMKGLGGEAKSAGRMIGANLIGPLAGAGAVAGITAMTRSALQAADAIGKGATKLGVSTDEYQRLGQMAERAGVSHEAVTTAVARMSRVIVDAQDGTKEAVDSLAALGYEADQLKGKRPEEIFRLLAETIGAMEDPTERMARAQEVFGRSGKDLIPMLTAYQDLRAEVEATQQLMSEDAVRAAEQFNDQVGQLGANIQSSLVNSGLIEWLADVSGSMTDIAKASKLVEEGVVDQESAWRKWASIALETQRYIPESVRGTIQDKLAGGSVQSNAITKNEESAERARLTAEKTADADRKRLADVAAGAGEAERAAQKKQAEDEAAAKAQSKIDAAIEAQTGKITERIRLQRLINQGLEREAAIEAAIGEAKRRNVDLTAVQEANIRTLTGHLYDLKHTEVPSMVEDIAGAALVGAPRHQGADVTALERMGALFGGAGTGTRQDRVQSEIRDINKRQLETLKVIEDKTEPAQLGAV